MCLATCVHSEWWVHTGEVCREDECVIWTLHIPCGDSLYCCGDLIPGTCEMMAVVVWNSLLAHSSWVRCRRLGHPCGNKLRLVRGVTLFCPLCHQGEGWEQSYRSYFYTVHVMFRITRCLWLDPCLALVRERACLAAACPCMETWAQPLGYMCSEGRGNLKWPCSFLYFSHGSSVSCWGRDASLGGRGHVLIHKLTYSAGSLWVWETH